MPGPCPPAERLAAALRDNEPGGGDAALAAHLAECPACQAQLEALAGGSGWLEAKAKGHTVSPLPTPHPLMQAMRELESSGRSLRDEPTEPPRLDFLRPSDQPGVLGRFGPYEVIAPVASGGMGIVLKARDPALDRIVALKILSPTLAANPLPRARFVREARAAAAVVHENVVPIYAVDECSGLPYLVMQFVNGRSLAERIRATGALRLEEILRIGAQTAAGLAAAHAQGLIHRDVKPGNILLENSVERVKLTDFGLARAADDVGLTRTGELAGTPEFMAPEQAGNETVDHRADLFSLGSVLYTMCTGASPFKADSVLAVIRKVGDDQPPPVDRVNPAVPRWLSDIIARLMAKTPAERYQSAQEVCESLERHLARVQHGDPGELPATTTRASSARTWRRIAISAAAAVVILWLCLFLLKIGPPGPSGGSRPATSPTPGFLQKPFVVRDESGTSVGSFVTIADALAAAPPGGVVELLWNGSREMPPVTLPAKPITLRAGKGFRPAWVHTNPAVSALTAVTALTLQEIELSLRPGATTGPVRPRLRPRMTRSGNGLIVISNAPLRLSHCVLQLPDPRLQGRGSALAEAGLTGIILHNVATCEMENSALLGSPWEAILWRRTVDQSATVADEGHEAMLSLSNCVVTAFKVFSPEVPEKSRSRLQIIRCTFQARHLIDFSEASAGRGLTVIALTNVFATSAMLWDGRGTTRDGLTASMRWQGRGNIFNLDTGGPRAGAYVVLNRSARESWPGTLSEWNQWWPEPETGSREATVTFADAANVTASASRVDFVRGAYKVDRMTFNESPPLTADQWSHLGADLDNVGPASR